MPVDSKTLVFGYYKTGNTKLCTLARSEQNLELGWYAVAATAIGLAWSNTCRGESSIVRRIWAWVRRQANSADVSASAGDNRAEIRSRTARAAEAPTTQARNSLATHDQVLCSVPFNACIKLCN
jgi:hypothetical protein